MNTLYKLVYSVFTFLYLVKHAKKMSSHYIELRNGLKFKTDQIMDFISIKEVILDDEYAVSKLPKNLSSVIDVGAGLGDSAALFAKTFPKSQILAFEPNPNQYQLLKNNIALNRFTNIKPYDFAVGTKKSYMLFVAPFNAHSSTVKNPRIKYTAYVKGMPLHRFIQGSIDLLKIDCEGGEIDVLKSIFPKQFAQIKRIIIEYHNHIIQNEDQKIVTLLKNYHYTIRMKKNKTVPTTGYIFAYY